MKKILFIFISCISIHLSANVIDDVKGAYNDSKTFINNVQNLINTAPDLVNNIIGNVDTFTGKVSSLSSSLTDAHINQNINTMNQAISRLVLPTFPDNFTFSSFTNGALTDFFTRIMTVYHNVHPILQATGNLITGINSILTSTGHLSSSAGNICNASKIFLNRMNFAPISNAAPQIGATETSLGGLHHTLSTTLPHTFNKLEDAANSMQRGIDSFYKSLGIVLKNTQKQIISLQNAAKAAGQNVPPPPPAPVPPPAPPAITVSSGPNAGMPPPPPLPM